MINIKMKFQLKFIYMFQLFYLVSKFYKFCIKILEKKEKIDKFYY